MSAKKVTFGTVPTAKPTAPTAEQWIENRGEEVAPAKRLTLDIPASLHSRIKIACAQRGISMVDAIRELLETHFS